MTTILRIDSSARTGLSGQGPRGSHTRRLTQYFVDRWLAFAPGTRIVNRDVALTPPTPVTDDWIAAAFAVSHRRESWMASMLAGSDMLIDELEVADIIVIGAPMYNFGVPSTLKAWIDNVVRVGRTFGFDRTRTGNPYWPMLAPGKQLVILGARGDGGYGEGGPLAASNLVDASLRVPLAYTGIAESWSIAAEWDEFADDRIAASLTAAEAEIDALIERLVVEVIADAA